MHRSLLLALALSCAPPAHARADGGEVPALVRLARSPAEHHRDAVNERTRTLERLIRALPNVVDATAALTLPDPASSPLDRPLPSPQVALVLRVRGQGPDDARLGALARSVVRDLAPSDLTISRHPLDPTPAPTVMRVGPFEVSARSATLLRTVLALSLAGNALLAGLLLYRARPNRPRNPFVDRHARRGRRA